MRKPIITSPLWTDFYKFSMQHSIFRGAYRDAEVTFGLKNRSNAKFPLTELVREEDLRWQLDATREAFRFSQADREHIASFSSIHPGFAEDDYQSFLQSFRLPPYRLWRDGTTWRVTSEGRWPEVTMWETPVMGIVACLAGETLAERAFGSGWPDAVRRENDRRLTGKIERLREHPGLRIIEFTTRRAASPEIHEHNLDHLIAELLPGQLLGTSNVFLAKKRGLKTLGTMAHELWMVRAALADLAGASDTELRATQMHVCDEWAVFYGSQLLTVLNETFGARSFYEDFGPERMKLWDRHRPDSGDPIVEGDRVMHAMEQSEVDPKLKGLVLADGQTVSSDGTGDDSMIRCHAHFRERTADTYGWGTNLGNDVGIPNLSIVMKAEAVNGCPTVKLSNNLAKAQGPSEKVERYKRAFGYTSTFNEECRY